MVKGISRRVVVVRPEGQGVFEQAIFLLRDTAAPRGDIVREACRITNGYLAVRTGRPRRRFTLRQMLGAGALGAAAASAVWLAVLLIL